MLTFRKSSLSFLKMSLCCICLSSFLMDSVYGFGIGSCPTYKNMENFNFSALEGTWYGVQKSKSLFKSNSDCVGLYFKPVNKVRFDLGLVVVDIRTGIPSYYTGYVLSFTEGSSKMNIQTNSKYSGVYQVLDTDYNDYAILWSCNKKGWTYHTDEIWVLSRQRSLTAAMYKKILESLKKFGLKADSLSSNSERCSYEFESAEESDGGNKANGTSETNNTNETTEISDTNQTTEPSTE